jgi:hypothetical protein
MERPTFRSGNRGAVYPDYAPHRDRVVLLQNELVPPSWHARSIVKPTVLVVWFEKKRGRAIQEVRETEIAGPHAGLFVRALAAMDVGAREISELDLVSALVVKNLYIVGANVLGLAIGGTTGDLVRAHGARTERVLREVLAVERARLGPEVTLDRDDVLARTIDAFLRPAARHRGPHREGAPRPRARSRPRGWPLHARARRDRDRCAQRVISRASPRRGR